MPILGLLLVDQKNCMSIFALVRLGQEKKHVHVLFVTDGWTGRTVSLVWHGWTGRTASLVWHGWTGRTASLVW